MEYIGNVDILNLEKMKNMWDIYVDILDLESMKQYRGNVDILELERVENIWDNVDICT